VMQIRMDVTENLESQARTRVVMST
jgi:hypothetical protein